MLVSNHKHAYSVDVVWPRLPATHHDDGGPFTDETLFSPLVQAGNEAFLHVFSPVVHTSRSVEQRVHRAVHVALHIARGRGGGGGGKRERERERENHGWAFF